MNFISFSCLVICTIETIYTYNSLWDGGWKNQLSDFEIKIGADKRIFRIYKGMEGWRSSNYKSDLYNQILQRSLKPRKISTIKNYIDTLLEKEFNQDAQK